MITSPRRILFVSYGAGHIAMVLPVIRALREHQPEWQIDLLALTTGAHAARAQGFECLGYRDFAAWYDSGQLQRLSQPLLDSTTHPQVDTDESVAYLGINMHDLVEQFGEAGAVQRYAQMGRWAFMPVRFMTRLLKWLKSDAVVTTNSPRSEQAVIEAARLADIPSVCMVDLFSPRGDPFLTRTHYADALATISALGKRNLMAGGIPAERIHVTGNPAFDSLFDPQHRTAACVDRAALGWRNKKVILWAGHLELLPPGMGQVEDPSEFPSLTERMLRDYVARRDDVALIVRYHPNHVAQFRRLMTESDGVAHPRILWSEPTQRHTHRDIHLCDVAVIQATTVGLEAAIAGKSVLSLDHSPSRHVFPCSAQGVSRGVPSFAALPGALDDALASPFVSELALNEASAAKEVALLIERMVTMKR